MFSPNMPSLFFWMRIYLNFYKKLEITHQSFDFKKEKDSCFVSMLLSHYRILFTCRNGYVCLSQKLFDYRLFQISFHRKSNHCFPLSFAYLPPKLNLHPNMGTDAIKIVALRCASFLNYPVIWITLREIRVNTYCTLV